MSRKDRRPGEELLRLHARHAKRRITSNLRQRIAQRREHVIRGFTAWCNVELLVWFEARDGAEAAIVREKQLKQWRRAWKIELIEKGNPEWRDLYDEIASF